MDYKYINSEYLDSVSGGDHEIINEIVMMFKDQSVEVYNEMLVYLEEKKYSQLGALAHKAKSSVLIMGMTELGNMLKTFELEAKAGEGTEKYKSYIERFKKETDEAILELDNLITNRRKES